MLNLSEKSAISHYEKLFALHNFEYLTNAQKVIIFYLNLEHDILKEITNKINYFDQKDVLEKEQIKVIKNIKTGYIPKVIIDDIDNLRNWHNEGKHENNMREAKYKSHLDTMIKTINFFSNISIPDELNNILENKQKNKEVKNNTLNKGKNKMYTIRLDYWSKLLLKMNNITELFQGTNARPGDYIDHGAGTTGLYYVFKVTGEYAKIELSISKDNANDKNPKFTNKKIFDELIKYKEDIEKIFGDKLLWERLDDNNSSRIKYQLNGVNIFNKDDWDKMIEFQINNMIKFENAMKEPLNKVKQKIK